MTPIPPAPPFLRRLNEQQEQEQEQEEQEAEVVCFKLEDGIRKSFLVGRHRRRRRGLAAAAAEAAGRVHSISRTNAKVTCPAAAAI